MSFAVAGVPAKRLALMFLSTSVVALASVQSQADTCTPPGTAGNDNVTCQADGNADNTPYNSGAGADTIGIVSGTFAGNIAAGDGNDTVTLDGGTVNAQIIGGNDNDTINLISGSAQSVNGAAGADTITLDGATIGNDIQASGGNDNITLLSGSTGGDVNSGSGDDTVLLDGATVGDDIVTGDGNDSITVQSGIITNEIEADAGNDVVQMLGGSVRTILTRLGDDTITLDGGDIVNDINAGAGADTINLFSGTIGGLVLGDTEDDIFNLNGLVSAADLDGGDGADTFNLLSGSIGDVLGNLGNDTFTLNGATVAGNLDGGDGDDSFALTSGSFGGNLLGGDGSDSATIGAAFDLTTITGTLDGGDDAASGDGFTDVLSIGAAGTLSGASLTNWERININAGGGTLALSGGTLTVSDEATLGLFVNSGTLDLMTAMAITGDVTVAGGRLLAATPGGTGSYSVSGDLSNSGTIDLTGTTPAAGDTFSVAGDYSGGGSILMDAVINPGGASDQLVIGGTISGGPTTITLTNVGGTGFDTGTGPGSGFALVDNSAGPGVAAGQFALAGGQVTVGAFSYGLVAETDGILYLQSAVLDQVLGYAALPEVIRERFPILRDRLGERRYGTGGTPALGETDNAGLWARIDADHRDIESGSGWDQDRGELEIGLDIPATSIGGGVVVFGISAHAVTTSANAAQGSDVDATGYGAGLSFTWFGDAGLYADLQGRMTAWSPDVSAPTGGSSSINGLSWGTAFELGKRIPLGDSLSVTPRAQAVYTDVDFDSFTDSGGVNVSLDDGDSFVLGGGVTLETLLSDSGVALFADAGVTHDLMKDSSIDASGTVFRSKLEDTWGEVAVGISAALGNGTSAYVKGDLGSPFGDTFGNSLSYGAEAGVRINF